MAKKTKNYKIKFEKETLNSDAYFQVSCNGEFLACFPTVDKAEKYVDDLKHTVILRTKKIRSYFRGIIIKTYFALHGTKYIVTCQSYSGHNDSILSVLDFKADTKEELLTQLRVFKKEQDLILELL